jgi:hypothetical protein
VRAFFSVRFHFSLDVSSLGFGPSNYFLRASSAFKLFGLGRQSLKLSPPSQQRFYFIQVRPPNLCFGLSTLFAQNTQILVATYQFGCHMSNTKVSPRFATPDGPVFVSNALCREIFHTYGMKFAPMDASGASQ